MIFVETAVFSAQASGSLFSDAELLSLQKDLIQNPSKGDLIKGGGGLRKIRLARQGSGKSGGYRVIYYLETRNLIYLLLAYPKSKQDTLSQKEINQLKTLIDQGSRHG